MKKHLSQLKNLLTGKKVIKLNIGCGTDYKEGWVNIDNNSDGNIDRLDLNWDLRNPLPFKENSVDFVFNEHFFEHLTVEEGQETMKYGVPLEEVDRSLVGKSPANYREERA